MKKTTCCAVSLLLVALLRCAADGLDQWTPAAWTVSSVSLGDLWGVAYGDGIYVEAGDRSVATSATGTQWTPSADIITSANASVTFKSIAVSSGGEFVLVGTYGTIFSSVDGINWVAQASPIDNHLYGVTWGNGSFVAVGQDTAIITSTDGTNWTEVSPTPAAGDLLCVTYGNGLFVAAATNGPVYTSRNATTWTKSGTVQNGLYSLAYGNGTFAGVGANGSVAASPDGSGWTQNTLPGAGAIHGVTFADGLFVADGDLGLVSTSADGLNWEMNFDNFGLVHEAYESASVANGRVFLAGQSGSNVMLNWPNDLNSVASGEGVSVAVGGQGLIVASTNGSPWGRQTSVTTNTLRAVVPGIVSGAFAFLAVGDQGTVAWCGNGMNWSVASTGTTSDLYAVAYTISNTFVAVGGGGAVFRSTNGSSWIAGNSGTNVALRAIGYHSAYANPGVLVAVGDNGTILTSPDDGLTWTPQDSGGTETLYTSLYVSMDGLYVSAGANSTALTSADATHWAANNTEATPIHGMAFGDETLVSVGEMGVVETSPDGITWAGRASPTTSGLYGVALVNNSFLAVGQLGTIINSGPVLAFKTLSSGTSSNLSGFAAGNGATSSNLVAVGAGGTIVSSSDGANFASVASPTTNALSSVIFAGGQYVGVGASGSIITSVNGVAWESAASGVAVGLTGVTYGQGHYVAVGANGTVLTSTNGANWAAVTLSQTENIVAVSFGNGIFVALDSDGTILTSPTATQWTLNTPGLVAPLVSITFANGTFLGIDASGGVYSSSDGVNWTDDFALPSNNYSSLTYFNGQLAAVGSGGSIVSATLSLGAPPSARNLYAITYAGGLYVTVGDGGTILTSEDGNNWIAPASYAGTANQLDGVAYGNGVYVAVGNNGEIITSSDGVSWNSIKSGPTANALTGVTFADEQFVAVGRSETFMASSDGSDWTLGSTAATTTDTTDDLAAVAHGDKLFVAVGDDNATTFSSPDATVWRQGGTGFLFNGSAATGITYGNGLFVATDTHGDIYTSTDGSNWTQQAATAQPLNGVSFGGGLFVAVGDYGLIFSSLDGVTWTAVPTVLSKTLDQSDLYAVTYDGNAFFMVGDSGLILSSVPKALTVPVPIQLSQTPYNPSSTDTNDNLQAITYGAGQFVIVGSDSTASYTSSNAVQWTEGGGGLADSSYIGVAYGDGLYVAIDANGGIYNSTDGSTWTRATGVQTTLNGLGYGKGVFLAVGDNGAAFTSSNGQQWVAQKAVVSDDLEAVIFDGANFVAVGDAGDVWISPDGVTWTSGGTEANGLTDPLYAIAYNGVRYVAVGGSGLIFTSTNATTSSSWAPPANYVVTDNALAGVAWGNGEFVAVGVNGWVVTSPDGLNWTAFNSSTLENLNAIEFADSQFVVAGNNGVILTVGQAPLITLQPTPAAQNAAVGKSFSLLVSATGSQSLSYQWQHYSTNLHNSVNISGATSNLLTITNLTLSEAGQYEVVVSDSQGSVTSLVAMVAIGVAPVFVSEPSRELLQPPGASTFFGCLANENANQPISYFWFFNGAPLNNGGNISGATTNELIVSPVVADSVGNYSVMISNAFGTVTSSNAALTLGTETQEPNVKITTPGSENARTIYPSMQGTASDDVRVLAVNYWITNVNNGTKSVTSGQATLDVTPHGNSFSLATWAISSPPLAGSNVLVVQSVNYSGLKSPVSTLSFFYEVPSPLSLTVSPAGTGTVTGTASIAGSARPANGADLFIGENYTVTVKPASSSWVFAGWTADGSRVTTGPTLSFTMEPNLSLSAVFVTNGFLGMAGRYDGLFSVTGATPTLGTAGLIGNLVIKTNGIFGATLYLGGSKTGFSGAFNLLGQATTSITNIVGTTKTITTFNLNWAVNNLVPQLTGTVKQMNNQGTGSFTADLEMPMAVTPSSSQDSAYTLLIDTNEFPVSLVVSGVRPPAALGYGYATITNNSGILSINGKLGDGYSFSQSVPLGQDGAFPLFTMTTNELLLGRVGLSASGVDGPSVTWIGPGKTNAALEEEGFTGTNRVYISAWTNSLSILSNLIPLGSTLTAFGGNIGESYNGVNEGGDLSVEVQFTQSSGLADVSGDTTALSATINPINGLITISEETRGTGLAGTYITSKGNGVLLQATNFGGGSWFFYDSKEKIDYPGTFTLTPRAH